MKFSKISDIPRTKMLFKHPIEPLHIFSIYLFVRKFDGVLEHDPRDGLVTGGRGQGSLVRPIAIRVRCNNNAHTQKYWSRADLNLLRSTKHNVLINVFS